MERLDFLCVMAADKRIAIPLNLVLSVEEAGPLTPLPFSPGRVEGLVMALGRVLPQMALAEVLGDALPPDEAAQAGRMVLRENALALYRLV